MAREAESRSREKAARVTRERDGLSFFRAIIFFLRALVGRLSVGLTAGRTAGPRLRIGFIQKVPGRPIFRRAFYRALFFRRFFRPSVRSDLHMRV